VDLLDDPVQARPVRRSLGADALVRQQGRLSARRQSGRPAHRHRAGRYVGARARYLGYRSRFAEGPGNLQFDEETWYFALSPFGPKTPTPSFYRAAVGDLRSFNARLEKCEAVFDARGDNLLVFIDRIANDIGATSAILRDRSEKYNSGWFDPRADDRFWFAYGQLYGYYGILTAAHADFRDVIAQRGLTQLWTELEDQLRSSLRIQPTIISNGDESGWLMPAHLATLGFYLLRVRSNLVEIRLVLDR
jgi:hypothetical protein